jgi:hypothetical protein
MNRVKLFLFTAIFVASAFLNSCGEHGFDDLFEDIFGVRSSSGGNETFSSSSSYIDEEPKEEEEDGSGPVIIPNDDELDSLKNETPNPSGVVEPLLKTKWGQGAPYKNMLPEQPRAPFCNLVAASQIMKYHNHPIRGSGRSEAYTMTNGVTIPSVNFEQISFDWNNMLDSYRSNGAGSTEQQQNAVASLIYYAGIGRKRDFISGASKNSWPFVFSTYFGYDRSVQQLDRKYYNYAEWWAIIREQLDARLPVLMNRWDDSGNHYIVIDGYDNTGKFHLNFGWSGSSDGWYSLNENEGWNYRSDIVINIKPDAGGMPTPYEMALTSFAASKTTVSQNELFIVSSSLKNLASFDVFPGGQISAVLVDNSDNIKAIIGSRSSGVREPGWNSSGDISSFVPGTIAPGQYKLKIAIKPTGGEWKIVTRSAIGDGIPNAIDFTVTAGEANGDGHGMALTSLATTKTTISQNELFTASASFRNISQDTYTGGQWGVALVDNTNNIVKAIGWRDLSQRDPGANIGVGSVDCYVPADVKPGQYKLRMVVRLTGGEWKIATMSMPDIPNSIPITVTPAEKGSPGGGYGLALKAFTTNKTVVSQSELINGLATNKTAVSQNELFTISTTLRNVAMEAFPGGQAGTALVDNNGNIKAIIGSRNISARNSGQENAGDAYSYVPSTIAPGQYKLRIAVKPTDSEEWRIATMSVGDTPNSIPITVTAGVAMADGHGMALTVFTTERTSINQGESAQFNISTTFRNVSQDTYAGGDWGIALVDNAEKIVAIVVYSALNSRVPGAVVPVTRLCSIPNTVPPGKYKLRMVIRETGGEWRTTTLALPDVPSSIDFEVK